MSTPTKPTNVVEALSAVMAEVRGVGKNQRHDSPSAKFMFRGVDAVVNAVGPALRNHGVVVAPVMSAASHRDVTTSGGKASRECTVAVTYRFYGPGGVEDYLDVQVPGEAMDSGDKGTAKAMSVAYRIALLQALCLPTDEKDPDMDAYERGHAQSEPETNGKSRADAMAEVQALGKKLDLSAAQLDGRFKAKFGHGSGQGTAAEFTEFADDLRAMTNGSPA